MVTYRIPLSRMYYGICYVLCDTMSQPIQNLYKNLFRLDIERFKTFTIGRVSLFVGTF